VRRRIAATVTIWRWRVNGRRRLSDMHLGHQVTRQISMSKLFTDRSAVACRRTRLLRLTGNRRLRYACRGPVTKMMNC
jgi:hypothetical protein